LKTASSLNSFAGANVMSVYELGIALDTSQARIVELEEVLRTQRDNMIDDYTKGSQYNK
jgi:hypothetical protein